MHNNKKKKKKNKTISTKLQNTIPIVQQSKNRTLPIKIESTKELPKQNMNGLYLIRKQSLLALNPTQNHNQIKSCGYILTPLVSLEKELS